MVRININPISENFIKTGYLSTTNDPSPSEINPYFNWANEIIKPIIKPNTEPNSVVKHPLIQKTIFKSMAWLG